jgi:hypothetical protein
MPFSPSVSPDNYDMLLPLPHGGRRSPRSRIYAYLVNQEHPTIGTEGYTDDSHSECEFENFENVSGRVSDDSWMAIRDGSACVSHEDRVDKIIELCTDPTWQDEAEACNLKGKIVAEFEDGGSRDMIDAIVSVFVDQRLAQEQLSEAEEDRDIAVERLNDETDAYRRHVNDAAQWCLSKQLVWGAAHAAHSIVSLHPFPATAGAIFRPRISSALLCAAARKRVLCSSGLLRTLLHRIALPFNFSHLKDNWLSPMARKNRIALTHRACGRCLVASLSRTQIDHNVARWLSRLDLGSPRFVQRSAWLLRNQESDGSDEEGCDESAFEIENRIQAIEDLVTVRLCFCSTTH